MAQETGNDTPEEMRAKALKRLGVAGVVTAAALAVLWWLDQGGEGRTTVRKPVVKPAPITAAAPSSADPVAPMVTAVAATLPPAAASSPTAPVAGTETPPPPQVNNAPLAPPRPGATPGAVQSPVLVGSFAPSPAAESFVVQVGIYHDPKAAQELVRRLGKLGVKARLETRVQVGPFASKAEADKALEALRRQGLNGVVAVPEAPSAASRR